MASQQAVTQLYQEILGRAPDAGGLQHYMRYGNTGAIRNEMLGSAEYKQRLAAQQAPAPAPASAAAAAPQGQNLNTQLVSFADQMAKDQAELLARQKAEQQGLFGQFTGAINSQEKLPDLYSRLQTQLGIPELSKTFQSMQGEIYKVKDQLDRLGEGITSRNLGTMQTEAQRQRQIAAESDPLRTALGRLGTGLEPIATAMSGAQSELGTLLNLNVQQQDRQLRPLEMQISSLGDTFAREMTGFTTSRQTQLDALVSKIQRDQQLSDREWQLAQDLASEERQYQQQLALARLNNSGGSGGGTASYLPSRAGSTGVQGASVSVPSISSFMPSTPKLAVTTSSGSSRVLQPTTTAKLQGSGNTLQGGGYKLQGNLSSAVNNLLRVR